MFRELRLMISSLVQSLTALFWAMMFLLLVLFAFSLVVMQGIANSLRNHRNDLSDDDVAFIEAHFNSVWRGMISVYMATSGLADWDEYFAFAERLSMFQACIWMLFTMFFTFA